MPDRLTPADRKRTMRAVKSAGTGLERRFRAMLVGAGLRGWQLNPDGIRGRPDIVFMEPKIAIFVDGCFWHGCPHCQRPLPQTNVEYWQRKIHRNVERDLRYTEALDQAGWRVFRVWEHQLRSPWERATILESIESALRKTLDN
ncbi:MAG: very short patch repair endonuclease [Aggregatilineales bacterium]